MKLIENPIQASTNLARMYPNIADFLFNKTAIKFFKKYTLGSTTVVYIDAFEKIDVVFLNLKKRITDKEIEYVVQQLLHVPTSEVTIIRDCKQKIEEKKQEAIDPKDIIVVEKINLEQE